MRGCGTPYGITQSSHRRPLTPTPLPRERGWGEGGQFESFELCRIGDHQTFRVHKPAAQRWEMGTYFEGFDPGSERTLAAWIRHASRTNPIFVAIQSWGKWRKGQ